MNIKQDVQPLAHAVKVIIICFNLEFVWKVIVLAGERTPGPLCNVLNTGLQAFPAEFAGVMLNSFLLRNGKWNEEGWKNIDSNRRIIQL